MGILNVFISIMTNQNNNTDMAAKTKKVGTRTTERRDKIAIIVAVIIAILILMPLIYTVNRDLNPNIRYQNWEKHSLKRLR